MAETRRAILRSKPDHTERERTERQPVYDADSTSFGPTHFICRICGKEFFATPFSYNGNIVCPHRCQSVPGIRVEQKNYIVGKDVDFYDEIFKEYASKQKHPVMKGLFEEGGGNISMSDKPSTYPDIPSPPSRIKRKNIFDGEDENLFSDQKVKGFPVDKFRQHGNSFDSVSPIVAPLSIVEPKWTVTQVAHGKSQNLCFEFIYNTV